MISPSNFYQNSRRYCACLWAGLILALLSAHAGACVRQSYVDNKDGTILDKQTGLVWQRCVLGQRWVIGAGCMGDAQEVSWAAAITAAQSEHFLDKHWRLPTNIELLDLADRGCSDPAVSPLLAQKLNSGSYGYFWSSTRDDEKPNLAWYSDFYTGKTYTSSVYITYNARFVRNSR